MFQNILQASSQKLPFLLMTWLTVTDSLKQSFQLYALLLDNHTNHKNNSSVQSIFLEQSSKILSNSPMWQSLSHNITYLVSALENQNWSLLWRILEVYIYSWLRSSPDFNCRVYQVPGSWHALTAYQIQTNINCANIYVHFLKYAQCNNFSGSETHSGSNNISVTHHAMQT